MKMFGLFIAGALLHTSFTAPCMADQYVIDFTTGHDLGLVLASGLRPKHTRSLEYLKCEATNIDVRVLLGPNSTIELSSCSITFTVLDDDVICAFEARCEERLTIDEARTRALLMAQKLGADVKDLEEGLARVKADPIGFSPFEFGVTRKWADGLAAGVGLSKTYFSQRPLLIYFAGGWPQERKNHHILRTPIPSPKGWEHVSLIPEPVFRSARSNAVQSASNPMPVRQADLLRIVDGSISGTRVSPASGQAEPVSLPTVPRPASRRRPILYSAVIGLGVLAFIALWKKRSSATK